MYKIKRNVSESCLNNLFSTVNGNYNLRSQSVFRAPGVITVFYGVSSIRYFGSVILNSLPNDFRNICVLIYLKRQYGDGNQLTVLVGCVKTT